jgi:hypothetical protein
LVLGAILARYWRDTGAILAPARYWRDTGAIPVRPDTGQILVRYRSDTGQIPVRYLRMLPVFRRTYITILVGYWLPPTL